MSKGYEGKIKKGGIMNVKAPNATEKPKGGKVHQGGDLRTGK